jgi:hypothetical protein
MILSQVQRRQVHWNQVDKVMERRRKMMMRINQRMNQIKIDERTNE